MEESPFGRSRRTARSPPPQPAQADDAAAIPSHDNHPSPSNKQSQPPSTLDCVSTSELSRWMKSIELLLNEVCNTAGESKMNTEQKIKINNVCRKLMNGTSDLAVQYQALKQQAKIAHCTIEHLKEQLNIADCLRTLNETLQESCSAVNTVLPQTENASFADMVKKGPNNYVKPNKLSTVVIYPSDKTKTSEDTQKLIQEIINPEELKLHVRSVRKVRNGGVLISTESKSDVDKLKQNKQLHSLDLKVEEPLKRRPRIMVIGVPSGLSETEVFDCIYEQNVAEKDQKMTKPQFMNSLKLSHKSGKKTAPFCTYIIEVSPAIRKILIGQDKIYVNWSSCAVKDFTFVSRCFKCQQYGHVAKFCREAENMCGHCAEAGHSVNDCINKSKSAVCATCRRFKKPNAHPTGDASCPARKFAEQRFINNIDYDS